MIILAIYTMHRKNLGSLHSLFLRVNHQPDDQVMVLLKVYATEQEVSHGIEDRGSINDLHALSYMGMMSNDSVSARFDQVFGGRALGRERMGGILHT